MVPIPASNTQTEILLCTADATTSMASVADKQRDLSSVTCVQSQSTTAHSPKGQPHSGTIVIVLYGIVSCYIYMYGP